MQHSHDKALLQLGPFLFSFAIILEESLRLPALLPGNRGSGLDRMRRLQMDKQKGARRDGYSLEERKSRTQTPILLLPSPFLLPLFQFSSVTQSCPTPCDLMACPASLSITNSRSLPKLMSIESGMPSNHLILCHPLLFLPSTFPSIRVFSNESALRIRSPKYWSFISNISPVNEHPGLISFRMDWLDLLVVQGTLKSLLQHHHSSKASVLWHSAFFIVPTLTSTHGY